MDWRLTYAPNRVCKGKEFTTVELLEKAGFCTIPASVPGNFELDLISAGKEADLCFSDNVWRAQDLENMHVWYHTVFTRTRETQYLRFEGIDTVAEIYVNGRLVQTADNMFLPWDVKDGLVQGENEILVHILPAVLESRKYIPAVSNSALKYSFGTLHMRKAAHMFGWDIMPRIVSAGLWKDVTVCEEKADLIREVCFITNWVDLDNRRAALRFYMDAGLEGDFAKEYTVRVEGRCGKSRFFMETTLWHNVFSCNIPVEDCVFWWPKNAGRPELYETEVTLLRNGEVRDVYRLKIGIRTVALERTESTDCDGNGEFVFRVNGKRIFILGTNWVPLHALHSQDPQRLPRALSLLDGIGCNMVRCWGGNVYESDEFFDFCDSHGILVWQDFAMGCAVYPQDEDFARRLEREAVYQVKRLRNHAALALWAGDNECDEAHKWDGFSRDPNRNRLTRRVLSDVVETHDYSRPYLPSSPYISPEVYQGKGSCPEMHLWGPRDYFKGEFYNNTFCHFASETGYQGFPSVRSLRRFLREPERIFEENGDATAEYLAHAMSMEPGTDAPYAYRIRLSYSQVETLFGKAEEDLADFVRQSQISQAEAMKFFIEKFRIGKWKRTGIIWWNLVDGWPQVSDAVVDFYFVKKLAYHYIRRSQEPVCLMFDEPKDGMLRLTAVNDLPEDRALRYRVTRVGDEDSEVMSGQALIRADTSAQIGALAFEEGEKAFYLIEWEMDGRTYKNHYFTNILDIDYSGYMRALRKCGMDEFEEME